MEEDVLYHLVRGPIQAEDDGSAWKWLGTPPLRTQVGPIRARLVSPIGHVVVTSSILVSPLAGEALKRLGLRGLVLSPATVVGSDIDPTEHSDYQQLRASIAVSLSPESIERGADGRVTLLKPYVLQAILGSDGVVAANLSDNPRVVLLSGAVRDCLNEVQAGLRFEPVRFADEPPAPPIDFPAEDRIPTREQLMAALRKKKPS